MKIETLKNNKQKKIVIGVIIFIAIASTIILATSKAKYRNTESIPLVRGTINYTPYDFKMIAMYQQNSSGTYDEIETMPGAEYIINEEKSYCTLDGENKDTNAVLKTIN